jgi:pyruvate/2-oxoacid:ferredoxin oxidoreductase alpha subunit
MTKGGGHGCYRNIVLAPSSVQEMAWLTMLAFELSDKYRNPAVLLADGFVGQMMEPLELQMVEPVIPEKPWAVKGTKETRQNLISSIHLTNDMMEDHIRKLEKKYQAIEAAECRWETYRAEDAEVLLVGYGIISRVLRTTVDLARQHGVKAGLFRPISLWPFPSKALAEAAKNVQRLMVVELSTGQMVEDVRLAVNGRKPVEFYGRTGGNVPSAEECQAELFTRMEVLV